MKEGDIKEETENKKNREKLEIEREEERNKMEWRRENLLHLGHQTTNRVSN